MRICRATNRAYRIMGVLATIGLLFVCGSGPALAKKKRPANGSDAAPASPKETVKPMSPANRKAACTAAYTKAHELAEAKHLREAKELLGKCALATCGPFLQKECTALYTQLDSDIPTVVPVVTDAAGQPYTLVEVRMDGELLTSRLDGHALPVDPGQHDFSFSTDAGVFATQNLTIVQGQRNRPLMVKFKRPTGQSPSPPPSPQATAPEHKGDSKP